MQLQLRRVRGSCLLRLHCDCPRPLAVGQRSCDSGEGRCYSNLCRFASDGCIITRALFRDFYCTAILERFVGASGCCTAPLHARQAHSLASFKIARVPILAISKAPTGAGLQSLMKTSLRVAGSCRCGVNQIVGSNLYAFAYCCPKPASCVTRPLSLRKTTWTPPAIACRQNADQPYLRPGRPIGTALHAKLQHLLSSCT